jgi:hypothetical protein
LFHKQQTLSDVKTLQLISYSEEPPVIKTTLLIVAFIGWFKNKKILLKEDYFEIIILKTFLKFKKKKDQETKPWESFRKKEYFCIINFEI